MKRRAGLLTAILPIMFLMNSAPASAQQTQPLVYGDLIGAAPGTYLTTFRAWPGVYYWVTIPPGVRVTADTELAPYITGRYIPPAPPPPQQTIVVVQPPPQDSIGLSFGFSRVDIVNGRRR
jgi:hypothetical protein